ncbi:MAG: N-6 DNA methylase, partial [Methylococcaceae bacterium]
MTLEQLLKDSAYKLTQFSPAQIQTLENSIIEKETRGKITPYVICLIRDKEIKLTPEEAVRQLFIDTLHTHYGYSLNRMQCEYPVKTGSSSKRADIVIFLNDFFDQPYIIVELKQPNVKDGQEQLKSYCRFEGAPLGIWTNGADIEFFISNQNSKSKTVRLDSLSGLPHANQTLAEYLHKAFTIKDLILNDKLERRSLKEIITQFEDVVLANSGADGFEEIFKLIFTKLFDEFQSGTDKDEINALLKHGTPLEAINDKDFRALQFRNTSNENDAEKREAEVKKRLETLFAQARKKWRGIFNNEDSFKLTAAHLSTCVSYLQDIKLFNSNLEVIDDAFEYLVSQESKSNKGQYFTPRYVIDMCVKMLNPQAHETMIDTAAGSCGFPMHTIFHVWQALDPNNINLLTSDKRSPEQIDYVQNNVFAIDFDPRSVRVGRALNLIAGDGQTNVLRLNTLDYNRWKETTEEQSWIDIYNEGFRKLKELRVDNDSYKKYNFDVLMANPPFAGDITDEGILGQYQLGKNQAGKAQTKVGRDILFIERNLDFLKDGGRMAVVLPQGRFNNSSDKDIREFIAQRCRLLAVVGLHGNTFKPHTGTKTSVLFVQKWHDELCPKVDDYPIFFATMQKSGKDNSGEKIYLKDSKGEKIKDKHGHFIIDHDLFNLDGLTQDGIAEAFIEFAKKEKLSFFDYDLASFKNLLGHNTTGGQALPDSQAKP